MATRTLFGSRFQNAWIALPGRVKPFNSASPLPLLNEVESLHLVVGIL